MARYQRLFRYERRADTLLTVRRATYAFSTEYDVARLHAYEPNIEHCARLAALSSRID